MLPIYDVERDIVRALLDSKNKGRLIIEAPTGSGKSTQLPQILIKKNIIPSGEIVILQPRKVAARMLAKRVADEVGCKLGDDVGYQVRFEKAVSKKTKIRFVTEGILLRQFLLDPTLSSVGAIVFDEFHERHLQSDVILALALELQNKNRSDLKLIVMSATLSTSRIAKYLYPCSIVKCSGRTFPVEIKYINVNLKVKPIWDVIADVMKKEVVKSDLSGDILVFVHGAHEIRKTIEKLRPIKHFKDALLIPLYGDLSHRQQEIALEPSDKRKIIISTNIAETSITIDGVEIVVDSGLARVASYDRVRGINTLLVDKIPESSADQRAGRAGRTSPGKCFRMWSEADHSMRPKELLPEILRLDLSEILLTLFASGVTDVESLEWLDLPNKSGIDRAKNILVSMKAIDIKTGKITNVGKKMASYPVHPRFSRMIIEADSRKCLQEVVLCIALSQGREIFTKKIQLNKCEFSNKNDISDFQPIMRAWLYAYRTNFELKKCQAYELNAKVSRESYLIAKSLLNVAGHSEHNFKDLRPDVSGENLAKVFLVGFYDNLFRKLSKSTMSCELVGGRKGKLVKGSLASDSNVSVAAEVNEIEGKEVSIIISKATAIKIDWIKEIFKDQLKEVEESRFDKGARRVVTDTTLKFLDLILERRPCSQVSVSSASKILTREIINGNLRIKGWGDKCDKWILRMNFVSKNYPEYDIPEFSENDKGLVIADFCDGAVSYKEIKDKPVLPFLLKWLSKVQEETVKRLAPERIKLLNGKEVAIIYESSGPKISIILQRLYDVNQTPSLCEGRVPLKVEILGPNHRPVQTTTDLQGFWRESYPNIKKQLKGRYPKHEWR